MFPGENADLLTTHNNIYVAGDIAGVEDACGRPMVEGKLVRIGGGIFAANIRRRTLPVSIVRQKAS